MPQTANRLRSDTRWWGWGDPSIDVTPGNSLELLLRKEGFAVDLEGTEGLPSISEVHLPVARELPTDLTDAAGPENVFTDPESRLRHASGQSLIDLLNLRQGKIESAPDAVLLARDQHQVSAILVAAAKSGVAVIPYGGGTSVVGGVTPPVDPDRPVVSLATSGLAKCSLDPVSRTATLGAGLRGPEVEAFLQEHGFTLGHFPQSWEYATIGGFAATRSAGQASNGYGRFDEMVLGARLATPVGVLGDSRVPHSSEGPSLLDCVLGSEGTLGLITEVDVAVRPVPVTAREAWILPGFDPGIELIRDFAQNGSLPAVVRLSDETETQLNLAMSGPSGMAARAFRAYLGLRGREGGSLLILGFEGGETQVRSERAEVRRRIRRAGGVPLGSRAGRSWEAGRFHGPYLREGLLDLGLIVETFETAASWSSYGEAVHEIRRVTEAAMAKSGLEGRLLCHLSHAYPDAASIYFTVVASVESRDPESSWLKVKTSALQAIQRLGLPISHHHGIGRDHTDVYAERVGKTGLHAIEGIRAALDPEGIMNPGCLLPAPVHHTP